MKSLKGVFLLAVAMLLFIPALAQKSSGEYVGFRLPSQKKQVLKFISVKSGNDLFTITGALIRPKKDNGLFFQPNLDRDYTGSFLVEASTDYLSLPIKLPSKTYQSIFYGFDIYTPYFRDTAIFKNDTSYNPLDRPFGLFQFAGWRTSGISNNDKFRYSAALKIGIIGGNMGKRFQNFIHGEFVNSTAITGWGAQIGNKGRVGYSFEFREEFLQWNLNKRAKWNKLFLSGFSEQKIGTYMTNAGIGLRLTNKSFKESNFNLMSRPGTPPNKLLKGIMYNLSFAGYYNIHNTMLEGYGVFNTTEHKNKNPNTMSKYFLPHDMVRRINFQVNNSLSYSGKRFTIFYNWYSISPETYLGNIGIRSFRTGKDLDISGRWHHFAEIGLVLRVK